MSRWDDRLRGHAVHEGLRLLGSEIDRLMSTAPDAAAAETLLRAQEVAAWAQRVLDGAVSALVSESMLGNLESAVADVQARIGEWETARDEPSLNEVDAGTDRLAAVLGWAAQAGAAAVPSVRTSAGNMRRSVTAYVRAIEGEVTDLRTQVNDAQAAVVAASADLATQKAAWTAEVEAATAAAKESWDTELAAETATLVEKADAMDARLDTLEASATKASAGIEAAKTSFEADFAEAEEARELAAAASQAKAQASWDEALVAFATGSEATIGGITAQGEAMVESLRALKTEAENAAADLGAIQIAGGYSAWAATEHRAADLWRFAAIGFAIAGGVIVLAFVLAEVFDWNAVGVSLELVGRVLASSVTFGLALYCGAQSGHHRSNENIAQLRALELGSLVPYVAQLEAADQAELRKVLAERFFGTAVAAPSKGAKSSAASPDVLTLIGKLLDKIPPAK